jgi:hypothetical protein
MSISLLKTKITLKKFQLDKYIFMNSEIIIIIFKKNYKKMKNENSRVCPN